MFVPFLLKIKNSVSRYLELISNGVPIVKMAGPQSFLKRMNLTRSFREVLICEKHPKQGMQSRAEIASSRGIRNSDLARSRNFRNLGYFLKKQLFLFRKLKRDENCLACYVIK